MSIYYLVENDQRVDVAFTQAQVESLSKHGWSMVKTFEDAEWADVADVANEYAEEQGKKLLGYAEDGGWNRTRGIVGANVPYDFGVGKSLI